MNVYLYNINNISLAGPRERRNEKTTMCRHYVRGPSERLARHLRLTPPSVVVVAASAVVEAAVAAARLGRTATRRAWRRGGLYPQLFRAGALHKKAAPRKRTHGPPGLWCATGLLRWRHLAPGPVPSAQKHSVGRYVAAAGRSGRDRATVSTLRSERRRRHRSLPA